MKRYKTFTYEREEPCGATCDGCGLDGDYLSLVEVIISVNESEEGGRRDEYDYCNDCLVAQAPKLVAAGSRSPIVTGDWTEDNE
ncbi:hypothetical protein FHR83_006690 [Actinoplanes campanulatus]|uniref:Uncharacterized protein n=1 Tax=Actinoplanes campanulatus TaxID=113559 RepID=A0A7W5AND9_9ACTN|nr:hypothetical protein [Actinoplanes campanulatus]MBB3098984.1 hypothetical protein [Actinoplanes campanulatus]GGN39568.1 hypothetical protein GCM10010109_67660 [Actinoplanes campanulatus]